MKWIEHKQYEEIAYELQQYMFFDSEIEYSTRSNKYRFRYTTTCNSLEEAKQQVLSKLFDTCKEIVKSDSYEEIKQLRFVHLHIGTWPGNIGQGYYIPNYKEFKWIQGKYLCTARTATNYAIRFYSKTDDSIIEKFAIKIIKRQANKFIREYEKPNSKRNT